MVTVRFTPFTLLCSILLFYSAYSGTGKPLKCFRKCHLTTNRFSDNASTVNQNTSPSTLSSTETVQMKDIQQTNISSSEILQTYTYQSSESKTTDIRSSPMEISSRFTPMSTVVTEPAGSESSIPIKTFPTYQSTVTYLYPGVVSNLSTSSAFPLHPLNISWERPQTPNGEIVQYYVQVFKTPMNRQCVLTMFLNCTDCRKNVSVPYLPDYGCYQINGPTFNSSNQRFGIIVKDERIRPYTYYGISVIAANVFGWGNLVSVYQETSQYTSGPVDIQSITGIYPHQIHIKWMNPTFENGQIVQYFIWVEDVNGQCVLTMSVNCTDCKPNISVPPWPDNSINNCTAKSGGQFNVTKQLSSIVITDDKILPCITYRVNIRLLNGYGWGNVTGNYTSISPNVSEPISNLSVIFSFPLAPLTIRWQPPENKTMEIIKYSIWIQRSDNNQCVLKTEMNCTDVFNNVSQSSHMDSNITECYSIPGLKFNSTDDIFSLIIRDLAIQPKSKYVVNVRPLTMCGWGPISNISVTTPQYQPDPVTNLQSIVDKSQIKIVWSYPIVHTINYKYDIQVYNGTFSYKDELRGGSYNFSSVSLEFCTYYTLCVMVIDDYKVPSVTRCISNTTGLSFVAINSISSSVTGNNIILTWTFGEQSNCLVQFNVATTVPENINVTNNKYEMRNLKYATPYTIKVTPFSFKKNSSVFSKGNSLDQVAITGEGVPSSVLSFKCVNQSYTGIKCTWAPPVEKNGKILNYWLTCKNESVIYNDNITSTTVTISEWVETDILYTCQVSASTSVGYGAPVFSFLIIVPSAVPDMNNIDMIPDAMSKVNIKVADEYSQAAITLPYSHFSNNGGTIQMFTLVISETRNNIVGNASITSLQYQNVAYGECITKNPCVYEIRLSPPKPKRALKRNTNPKANWQNEEYIVGNNLLGNKSDHNSNGPLKSGTLYIIGFRAYTSAGFVTVGFIERKTAVNKISTIVGVSVAVFVIICLSIAIYFIIRYKRNKHVSEATNPAITHLLPVDSKSPAVHEFHENYEFMKQDSNGRLLDDFREIKELAVKLERQKVIMFTEGNDAKNRFSNIKPYKHNRVKLLAKNDYINASKICSAHWQSEKENECFCSNIYIATQGPIGENREPKAQTVGDFWRMILENNVCVIVNLTRVEEHGKEKCSQYWPTEINQKITYYSEDDPINVEMNSSMDYSIFVERVFNVSMDEKEISVTQLHMLAWKDHGCPTTSEFLAFYSAYRKARQSNQAIVVHCSAGVGRTGTFILIDEELSRILKEDDRIEIYNNLLNLRKCRCQMVQTESQYCFIYSVIHEYLVQAGLIRIPRDNREDTNLFRQSYENPIFVE